MSAASRERFADVVRAGGAAGDPADVRLDLALLLLSAEAMPDDGAGLDTLLSRGLAELDALAGHVPEEGRDDLRLRTALGGFAGSSSDYARLESSLLPDVLRRRRGLPILLSTVWTEVARRAGVPAYGVGLPGHFVVGVGDPDGTRVLVDPFTGGRLLPYDRARDIAAESGRSLRPEHLRPHDPIDTIDRVLGNIRAWASTPERARHRVWAAELALLLPRHDLGLRREYGEALVAVGRYVEASAVLEEYADTVSGPMPLEAEHARRIARQARARLN
ncbi:MAG TPA: transglutaminase-like domain-containing protein [Candidatus Angelobacter sp.]|nr:transglutaminase-like domain-containing protein [Candidatus Angelobacter sp.]